MEQLLAPRRCRWQDESVSRSWWKSLFKRPVPEDEPVVTDHSSNANEPEPEAAAIVSQVPSFIKRVASSHEQQENQPDEQGNTGQGPCRNPLGALARLSRSALGSGLGGRESTRTQADSTQSISSGLGILGEIEVAPLLEGIASLEYRHGDEHDAFFDPASRRVIKLTVPGGFGARGGLEEYLQRMAWANEFFQDDWLFEGWVKFPNEALPRMVTSQPWYRVKPVKPSPTPEEIDAYMWQAGFLKAYDGAWIHREREIMASDALPKNFVLDVAGYVQPIDVILLAPSDSQWERLQNMVHNQPQA